MKLLIFTEHKDTLDYLAGDGRDGRPLGKLREWGLTVTQIHGGMKIGDRDTPGTRIYAEREFREDGPGPRRHRGGRRRHQPPVLLVHDQLRHPLEPGPPGAAHGPHPPLRPGARLPHLQLRRREHARGPRACRSSSTGSREIRNELGTDQVFDVVGEVFPANLLEKLFRDMYARRIDRRNIEDRIVRDVDPERFRAITDVDAGGAGQDAS